MESTPKIASNLLWTPAGVVRDPLLTLAADGRVLALERCARPDSVPFAVFYSGMLIPDFPSDWRVAFGRMQAAAAMPLDSLLREVVPASEGVLVVISGLDYDTMRLTDRSTIRLITA